MKDIAVKAGIGMLPSDNRNVPVEQIVVPMNKG